MRTVVLVTSAGGRRYGAFPSQHDGRDYTLPYRVKISWRPPTASLSEFLGPVKDQSTLGACTGFGSAGMREFLSRKYGTVDADKTNVYSPLDIYWNERDMEGDVDTDGGAQIRTACQVLSSRGVCLEQEDLYQPANFKVPPTAEQIAQATRFKAQGYHRLFDLDDMRSCLASGYVCIIGFAVYESFEGIASDGVMPMPHSGEALLGGHCVLVYGYDDTEKVLMCRNSWGPSWGKGGNFYMPYAFASDRSKLFDAFISHLGNPWK